MSVSDTLTAPVFLTYLIPYLFTYLFVKKNTECETTNLERSGLFVRMLNKHSYRQTDWLAGL